MKKLFSILLAAVLTFSLTAFVSADSASDHGFGNGVVYVDGDYAGETSNGTKVAPYTTIKEAADSLGTAGGTVVLMGHVLTNSSQHLGGAGSAGILITSVDPTDGTDYRTSGAILEYSKAIYPDTNTVFKNINFYNGGSSTYVNAYGYHLTLGSGVALGSINGTSSPDGIRLRGGSDGLSCDSTCLELSVGGDVAKKTYVGSAGAGCVYGDATLIIRSGLYSSTGLINFGNSSKKAGAAIGGNANLIVYGIASGSKLDPSASVDSLGGAANFVFNNGTYALLNPSTTVGAAVSTLAAKGVYIIDSAVGGTVVPLATTVTNNIPDDTHGKFVITTEHTGILVNGEPIEKNASNVYDLGDPGLYVVTYADLSNEKHTVSGSVLLAREEGDTAVSIARMLIIDGDGKAVVEEALEDENTDSSPLSFEYELSEGTYTAQITKNGYLPCEFTFTIGGENTVIPDITLIPGDIVESTDASCGNGKVDVNDFIRVVRGLSSNSTVREYVDINEDGAVTVADIALLKSSFGTEAEYTVVPGSYVKKIALVNSGRTVDVVPASVRSYLTETFANPVIDYTSDAYASVKMAACDPVTFSWSYDNFRPTSAILTLATKPDFSDAKEYAVSGSSYTLGNVYTGTTYYWKVKTEADGRTVTSPVGTVNILPGPRMLSVSGAYNMRDVGAWKTEDGRQMKQGLLIRSARFDTIGAAGIATMVGDMGIRTEIDLRGNSSLNEFGYTESTGPLGSAVKYVNLAGSYYANALSSDATREALSIISDIDNYPIVYHCLGGADRTGTLSVLVQALCGCDEVTVVADFELTNERGRNYAQFPLLMSTLKNAAGSNLREKTESCVLALGCTRMQISNIYNILMTDSAVFTGTSLTAPTVSGDSRIFTLDLRESGGVAGVTVLGEDAEWELSGNTLTVASASGDGVITLCDGETLRF